MPLDFARYLLELDELYARFIAGLRETTLSACRGGRGGAYRNERPVPDRFLGDHLVRHPAMHWGQVRTLPNLYRRTRGEPARFFPDNPTFPQ